MYKCLCCNAEFKEPKVVRGDYHSETTPPSYEHDIGVCPKCNGEEIAEGDYCASCGKFTVYDSYDSEHKLCDKCKKHAVGTFLSFRDTIQEALGEEKYKYLKTRGYIG